MVPVAIVGEAFVLIRPDTTPFMPELEAKMAAQQAVVPAAVVPAAGGAGAAGLTGLEAESATAAAAIEGDTARAARAIEQVAPAAERTAARGGGAFVNLANLIGIQASSITGAENVIEENLGKLDKAGFAATSSVEGMGAGIPILAGLAAAALVVGGSAIEFEHWGEAVHRVSQLTGSGAEEASRLVYAFDLAGVSTDKVAIALGRLSRNIQGGQLDLQRYGLEVAHNADGSVNLNETVLNLADAMHELGPGVASNTLALSALGRGGAALVPILVQGRDALKDLMNQTPSGLILSDEDAHRAHEFSISLRQLKIDAQAVFVTIGTEVVPVLIELAGVLDFVVRHGQGVLKFFAQVGVEGIPVIGPLINIVGKWSDAHGGLNAELQKTIQALTDQANAADEMSAAEERAQTATKDLTDKMNLVGQSAAAVIEDERSVVTAHRSRESAERELARAQEDLSKIQKEGGVDLAKYTAAVERAHSAEESLTRARHEAIDAAQSIHEKELALAEAIDLFGQNSEEARKAGVELGDAHFRLDQSNQSATDAEHDLARAHDDAAKAAAGGTDALRRLEDAKQRVVDARAGVEDAIYGEAKAAAQLRDDMDGAAGKTVDAQDKTLSLIAALETVAATLDPKSPIRANLQGYIDSLKVAADAEANLRDKIAGGGVQGERSAGYFAQQAADSKQSGERSSSFFAEKADIHNTINVYGVQDPAQVAATVDQFLSADWLPAPAGK